MCGRHAPKGRFLLCILIISLLLSGCWDRREVETLAFVTASGIDQAPGDPENPFGWKELELSVRVANAGETGGGDPGAGSGTSGAGSPGTVIVGHGVTPWDAFLDIQSASGRIMYVAHNRVVVISSDIAKDGHMREVIDFFDRSRQARRSGYILVADGLPARDVVGRESPIADRASSGLYELVRFNHSMRGMPQVTLNDFIVRATLEGIDPIAGRVGAVPKGSPSASSERANDGGGSDSKRTVALTGLALFRGDLLVGFLDEEETRGALWAMGKISSGFVNVPCPNAPSQSYVFEVQRSSGAISIQIEPELRGKVQITMEGGLGDLACPAGGFNTTTSAIQVAHVRLKERVLASVEGAIHKAQTLQSDPFGFGADFLRKNHREWREIKDRWHESIWPQLPVDIELNVDIRRPGLVGSPYKVSR